MASHPGITQSAGLSFRVRSRSFVVNGVAVHSGRPLACETCDRRLVVSEKSYQISGERTRRLLVCSRQDSGTFAREFWRVGASPFQAFDTDPGNWVVCT